VKNGQGIAINDALIDNELSDNTLHRLSDTELPDYGYYLVYGENAQSNPAITEFAQWILDTASKKIM